MPRDAVIVSTARTGIGKAYRGAFNATPSPTLAAHPIRAAIERAKVDPAEVDDVIMGAALQQGVQTTIGRTAALRAGLPVTVAGMSIDRQCARSESQGFGVKAPKGVQGVEITTACERCHPGIIQKEDFVAWRPCRCRLDCL